MQCRVLKDLCRALVLCPETKPEGWGVHFLTAQRFKVEARKLEHHYPHALKVK